MLSLFYRSMALASRLLGPWFFSLVAQGIATGYFLLAPRRTSVSVGFYRALFPQRGRLFHLLCTWQQFRNFTSVYLDRLELGREGRITCTHEGWEHLENALDRNSGGIVLMSHLGNWEIAAHFMQRRRAHLRLILFMGMRAKAEIERLQKQDLERRGIRILAVEKGAGAPFDLLEALDFLKSGGLVSMTGDTLWHPGQRSVPVAFLGHEVRLPETPHLLAMLSGAPLYVFFSRRTGRRRYHLSLSAPIAVDHAGRRERTAAIRRSAQAYADLLEKTLSENPLEWYHFEQFLGPRLK
ncbi:MAG: lysophospholipid acyltransferase family protein [Desulfobacterales bacterium]